MSPLGSKKVLKGAIVYFDVLQPEHAEIGQFVGLQVPAFAKAMTQYSGINAEGLMLRLCRSALG